MILSVVVGVDEDTKIKKIYSEREYWVETSLRSLKFFRVGNGDFSSLRMRILEKTRTDPTLFPPQNDFPFTFLQCFYHNSFLNIHMYVVFFNSDKWKIFITRKTYYLTQNSEVNFSYVRNQSFLNASVNKFLFTLVNILFYYYEKPLL